MTRQGMGASAASDSRLAQVRRAMRSARIDLMIVADGTNTIWLTGFSCSNSVTIITAREAVFLTDFRYIEKASASIEEFDVRLMTQNAPDELRALVRSLAPKVIGFEGNLPFSRYETWRKAFGRVKWQQADTVVADLRAIKTDAEIREIAANQRINEKILLQAVEGSEAGDREAEIQKHIRMLMIQAGVEEAFETIVATGPNSSLPHAVPGARKLRRGDYLLIDMGVKAKLYHSDMTRTYVVGNASDEHRRIYDIVLEAQRRALAAIEPGAICREVDAQARDYIASQGHAEHFGHGLGHGVGLEIHEGPTLNPRSNTVLRPGMVVTVEPGIYVPGFGGVRIEDLVVVTEKGYRNLTKAPKGLSVLL